MRMAERQVRRVLADRAGDSAGANPGSESRERAASDGGANADEEAGHRSLEEGASGLIARLRTRQV